MDALNLEPSWWSRNTGDSNEEDDLLDPAFRARQEHEALHQPTITFTTIPPTELPITCHTLLIATEPLSSSFLRSTFFPSPSSSPSPPAPVLLATCALQSPDSASASSTLQQRPALLSGASLYSVPGQPSLVVGVNYSEVADEQAMAWSAGFMSHVQPERLLILDTAPLSSYVSSSSPPTASPPLVHALRSSDAPPLPPTTSPLPPPHLLHSLAAALLVHCELSSIPATLLVSYASPHFIADSIEAFLAVQPLLSPNAPLPRRSAREYERGWEEVAHAVKTGGRNRVGQGSGASSLLHGPNPELFL